VRIWRGKFPTDLTSPPPLRIRCRALGIDIAQPRLFWRVESPTRGQRSERQTAYQILVASTLESLSQDHGDLWDRDASLRTRRLTSVTPEKNSRRRSKFLETRAFDRDGTPPLERTGTWTMALLAPADERRWIARVGERVGVLRRIRGEAG